MKKKKATQVFGICATTIKSTPTIPCSPYSASPKHESIMACVIL